jgi:ABC-type multidrug transport system fused ATPase/permease subunit
MIGRVIRTVWDEYRLLTLLACVLLTLVGVLNGVTIVSVLPLFELLQGGQVGDSFIANLFEKLLSAFRTHISMASLLVAVGVMTLLKAVCFIGQEMLFQYIQVRMEMDRKREIFGAIMKTNMAHLYQRNFGQLTNVVLRETNTVAQLVEHLARFTIGVFNALVYVLAVLLVDWKLTVLTAVVSAATYAAMRGIFRQAKRVGYRIAGLNGVVQELADVALFGYKNVKSYVVERAMTTRLAETMRKWRGLHLRLIGTESVLKSFFEPMVVVVAIFVFLVYRIEMAVFVTFVAALTRMNKEIREVQKAHYRIARNAGSLQMYNEVLADLRAHPYPDERRGAEFRALGHELVFDQVVYTYKSSRDAFTLGPVSLRAPRGGMVALVGPSGSGKSTCIDLASGLLLPDAGQIRLDGVNLADLSLASYRRRVGYVTQDIFLLNDSVLNNVIFMDEGISAEDARRACALASADEFIRGLPKGYDTIVGERGARLSGGQKQRISLARALARNPAVLILDEATSALDNESERRIHAALDSLVGTVTIIIIAHRLSTVRSADYLYVFEKGRITEHGRYDELLARKGKLFDMDAAAGGGVR